MNFLFVGILTLSILTGNVSGNEVDVNEENQITNQDTATENENIPDNLPEDNSDNEVDYPDALSDYPNNEVDYPDALSDYPDNGQDLHLLCESVDRLELGIDAIIKMQIVSSFLLSLIASAIIVSLFMEWFTK